MFNQGEDEKEKMFMWVHKRMTLCVTTLFIQANSECGVASKYTKKFM